MEKARPGQNRKRAVHAPILTWPRNGGRMGGPQARALPAPPAPGACTAQNKKASRGTSRAQEFLQILRCGASSHASEPYHTMVVARGGSRPGVDWEAEQNKKRSRLGVPRRLPTGFI